MLVEYMITQCWIINPILTMTAVMNKHLLFSLPGVLMTEIYEYDNTYRIFGSDKFKKDLHNGWLKKQNSYVKEQVTYLIKDYKYNFPVCMYKNEYCFVGGPSDQMFSDTLYRVHITRKDGVMIYVAPPKYDVLYFKVLPNEFVNKEKEFFENLRFDGFFCHPNTNLSSFWNSGEIYKNLNHICVPFDNNRWHETFEGQRRAPFMYRNLNFWF